MAKSQEITVYTEQTQDVRFPLAGIDQTFGFGRQPTSKTILDYARTTIKAVNVRAFEPGTGRGRGGQRPGLSDYISGPVSTNGKHVQELQAITTTWFFPADGGSGGGLGPIPGSDAKLPVYAINGVTVSSGSRIVWSVPDSNEDVKTYSVAAVTVNAAADPVLVAGTVIGQEIVLMEDGQESQARIAITDLASDRNALVTAVPEEENLYFFGTASDGKLVGKAVDAAGTPLWSNSNIGSTSDLGSDDAQPAFICNDETTAFVNLPDTGVVQVTLATGAALSPFVRCSNATITTAAGNAYHNAGQCATNGTNIAILVATDTSPAKYGVVFISVATGVASLVQTELETVDLGYPWADFSGESYLVSDGTSFYLMRYQYERNADDGQKYSKVIKLNGTTGAISQTSEDVPVPMKAIGYGSHDDVIFLSSAYFMSASVLNIFGGGITPSFKSFFDAGTYTSAGLFAGGGTTAAANDFNAAVALVAVSEGTIKVAYNGLWTTPTGGTSALDDEVLVIRSTVLNGKVYFLDTVTWAYYDAVTNTVLTWAATAGSLPVDSRSNKPKLIVTWRGRICLSGLPMEPQNIYFSRVNDATDWNDGPVSPAADDPLVLNASELGEVGDVITCLIPYSDDVLLIGCANQIWSLTGDPLYGGQLQRVTEAVGMAWGTPWCKDPAGTVYFMSSQAQIYTMRPGEKPVPISLRIRQELAKIDLAAVVVRLAWNEPRSELMVFVTRKGMAQPTTHFCYEARTQSWWMDRLALDTFNPVAVLQWYGTTIRDRGVLIGSWEGTVRMLDEDSANDDGFDIESDVYFGPLMDREFNELLMTELQVIAGKDVSSLRWDLYRGRTAEEAFASESFANGVWEADQSTTEPVRCAGHSIYIRLRANRPWAIEALRVKMGAVGEARRRAY